MTAANDGMLIQKIYLGIFALLVVTFVLVVVASLMT